MAKLYMLAIFGRQYTNEKSGNSTVSFFDLETSREISVTLQKQTIPEAVIANKNPRQIVLDNFEFRKSDNGGYLTCEAIHDASTDQPVAAVQQKQGGK